MQSAADPANVAASSLTESAPVPYPIALFTSVQEQECDTVFVDRISKRFQAKISGDEILEISEVARDASAVPDPAWSSSALGLTAMVLVSPFEAPESEPIQIMSMYNVTLEIAPNLKAYLVSNAIKHELGSAEALVHDAGGDRITMPLEWSYNVATNSHTISVNGRAIGSTSAVAVSAVRDPSDTLISVHSADDVTTVALWRQALSSAQLTGFLAHAEHLMADLNDTSFIASDSSSSSESAAADVSKPWFQRADALETWQRGRVAPNGNSVTLQSATDGIDSFAIVDSGTGVFQCLGEQNSPSIRTAIADAVVTSGTWVFEVRAPCR